MARVPNTTLTPTQPSTVLFAEPAVGATRVLLRHFRGVDGSRDATLGCEWKVARPSRRNYESRRAARGGLLGDARSRTGSGKHVVKWARLVGQAGAGGGEGERAFA